MVDNVFKHTVITVMYEARYPTRTKTGLVGTFCLESFDSVLSAVEEVAKQAESEREPCPPFGRLEYLEVLFATMAPHVAGAKLVVPTWMSPTEFTAAIGHARALASSTSRALTRPPANHTFPEV